MCIRDRPGLAPPPSPEPLCPALPSGAAGGRAVPCGCGAEPGRSASLSPARASIPSAASHLWLPTGAGSDPDIEIPDVPGSPCWPCHWPSEAASDGACCRACLAGNVWYRSKSPLLKFRITNKNSFVVFAHI